MPRAPLRVHRTSLPCRVLLGALRFLTPTPGGAPGRGGDADGGRRGLSPCAHPLRHRELEPGIPRSASPLRLLRLALPLLALACAGRAAIHPRAAEELVRGYRHLGAGDPERAEVAFEHALEFNPDIPEAHNGLGIVARIRGDLAGARARFERAIRLDPDFAEGHSNLGETLLALGRPAAAEAELRAALRVDPDLAEARHNLARALVRRGLASPDERAASFSRARRELLHLLETDDRRAGAHHDLGFLELAAGDPARAEASYRRAAELAPSSHEALHGLCVSLVRLGRCAEAARACARCLELAPGADACRTSLRGARACE